MKTHVLNPFEHDLTDLCRRYGVRRLEVFGSINRVRSLDAAQDVDMIVDFQPQPDENRFDRYFSFKEAVEALLGKPVDLIEASALHNRAFLKSIEPDRTPVYAD